MVYTEPWFTVTEPWFTVTEPWFTVTEASLTVTEVLFTVTESWFTLTEPWFAVTEPLFILSHGFTNFHCYVEECVSVTCNVVRFVNYRYSLLLVRLYPPCKLICKEDRVTNAAEGNTDAP